MSGAVWGYAKSIDADEYSGAYDTREEAENDAREDSDGEDMWIIEGEWPDAALVADALDIEDLCQLAEENNDLSFDDPTFGPKPWAEEALREWARQWISVKRWRVTGDPICVPAIPKEGK